MTRINDCIVLMRRLLLAAVAILPTACVSDIDDCTPKSPENAAPVIFSLDLNSSSSISTRADETTGDTSNPDNTSTDNLWSGSYNTGENDEMDQVIDPDNLHILIFNSSSEKLIAWVMNARMSNDPENNKQDFSGLLSKSIDDFKTAVGFTQEAVEGSEVIILALANWTRGNVNLPLKEGMNLSDLENDQKKFSWDASRSVMDNGYIPMWGQCRAKVTFSDGKVTLPTVKLLRSLAKVRITLNNASTANSYDMMSVQIQNYDKIGYYLPKDIRSEATEEGGATPLKSSTEELSVNDCFNPYKSSCLVSTGLIELPANTKSYTLYLPEQINDGTDTDATSLPIINITLKSLGSEGDETSRECVLWFTNTGRNDGTPKNIIRNHQYDFTISVN